jgi:hypothetical protein
VWDVAKEDGEVIEDARDSYVQDFNGIMWHFRESTTEFENGEPLSLEGSVETGVNDAKPGIIMEAIPRVGCALRVRFQRFKIVQEDFVAARYPSYSA